MILQRYTIAKNITGKIRKINFKKQDSSKNMPVKLFIYLFIYSNSITQMIKIRIKIKNYKNKNKKL